MAQRKVDIPGPRPDMKGGLAPVLIAPTDSVLDERRSIRENRLRAQTLGIQQHMRIKHPETGVKIITRETGRRNDPWLASDRDMGYEAKPGE